MNFNILNKIVGAELQAVDLRKLAKLETGDIVHTLAGPVFRVTAKVTSSNKTVLCVTNLAGQPINLTAEKFAAMVPLSPLFARIAARFRFCASLKFSVIVHEALKQAGMPIDPKMNWDGWFNTTYLSRLYSNTNVHDKELIREAAQEIIIKELWDRNALSKFEEAMNSWKPLQQYKDKPLEKRVTEYLKTLFSWRYSDAVDNLRRLSQSVDTPSGRRYKCEDCGKTFFSGSSKESLNCPKCHSKDVKPYGGTVPMFKETDESASTSSPSRGGMRNPEGDLTTNILDIPEHATQPEVEETMQWEDISRFSKLFNDWIDKKYKPQQAKNYKLLFSLMLRDAREDTKSSHSSRRMYADEWMKRTGLSHDAFKQYVRELVNNVETFVDENPELEKSFEFVQLLMNVLRKKRKDEVVSEPKASSLTLAAVEEKQSATDPYANQQPNTSGSPVQVLDPAKQELQDKSKMPSLRTVQPGQMQQQQPQRTVAPEILPVKHGAEGSNWGVHGGEYDQLPKKCLSDLSQPFIAYYAVRWWQKELGFNVPREEAIRFIKEGGGGIWTEEELSAMPDITLSQIVLWIVSRQQQEESRNKTSGNEEELEKLRADLGKQLDDSETPKDPELQEALKRNKDEYNRRHGRPVTSAGEGRIEPEPEREKAYNAVMGRYGRYVEWEGDTLTIPRSYKGKIEELVHDSGGILEDADELMITSEDKESAKRGKHCTNCGSDQIQVLPQDGSYIDVCQGCGNTGNFSNFMAVSEADISGGQLVNSQCPLCGHSPIYLEDPSHNLPNKYYCHSCNKGFDEIVDRDTSPGEHADNPGPWDRHGKPLTSSNKLTADEGDSDQDYPNLTQLTWYGTPNLISKSLDILEKMPANFIAIFWEGGYGGAGTIRVAPLKIAPKTLQEFADVFESEPRYVAAAAAEGYYSFISKEDLISAFEQLLQNPGQDPSYFTDTEGMNSLMELPDWEAQYRRYHKFSSTKRYEYYGHGQIHFENKTQVWLWYGEIMGQLSDGMWENAPPRNHWEPLADANVSVGTPGMKDVWTKRIYNFSRSDLLSLVGDRMLWYGKGAIAYPNIADDESVIRAIGVVGQTQGKLFYDFQKSDFAKAEEYTGDNLALIVTKLNDAKYSRSQMVGDLKQMSDVIAGRKSKLSPHAPASEDQSGEAPKQILSGITFCITGVFPEKRDEITKKLVNLGAVAHGSVTRSTQVLIVGEKPGRDKTQAAARLGTKEVGIEYLQDVFDKAGVPFGKKACWKSAFLISAAPSNFSGRQSLAAGGKRAAPNWLNDLETRGYSRDTMAVQVVGVKDGEITPNGHGYQMFPNLTEAKKVFPDLDPDHSGKRFSWAMRGETPGPDSYPAMRFESWAAEQMYST
jgi:transposase-like protein